MSERTLSRLWTVLIVLACVNVVFFLTDVGRWVWGWVS